MEDKYIYETKSVYEMRLVVCRYTMLSVLQDIKNWRRELYKGYDNNLKYLCNGKIYTSEELRKATDLPRDEHGLIKDCKSIYYDSYIIDKIDDLLYEVRDLLD